NESTHCDKKHCFEHLKLIIYYYHGKENGMKQKNKKNIKKQTITICILTICLLLILLMIFYKSNEDPLSEQSSIKNHQSDNTNSTPAKEVAASYPHQVIANDRLFLYEAPDGESACLYEVDQNEELTCLEGLGKWAKVRFTTGETGYALSAYLDIKREKKYNTKFVVPSSEPLYNMGNDLCYSTNKNYNVPLSILTKLAEHIEKFPYKQGFYLYDIESGFYLSFNAEMHFYNASTVKAQNALFVYNLLDNDEAKLTDRLTYTEEYFSDDTGILHTKPFGMQYNLSTILEYSLRYSDNAAYYMCLDRYGLYEFNDYIKSLGCEVSGGLEPLSKWGFSTPRDTAIIWKEIYRYIHKGAYGQSFLQNMVESQNEIISAQLPEYTVAHKYGWSTSFYNDVAIVYGKRPYILAVFTESSGGYEEREYIKQLTAILNELIEDYASKL
ncbi:serine hydrolase, partial [Eubacteriales bacterium OttesenSCG-928-G02]|nr:serine hydrolase [Eubacteriales bacterium OttesenSCG-928-G02]